MKVREGRASEIEEIYAIYEMKQNKHFLGFVMKVQVLAGIEQGSVLVCEDEEGTLQGVLRFTYNVRKPYMTLSEVATVEHSRGVGTMLVGAMRKYNKDIRLKVTNDNDNAYDFYVRRGFKQIKVESGRRRKLYVMQLKNSTQSKLF